MTDLRHTERSAPTLLTASTEPPERITAIVVGLLAAGFSVWVLLTLPIPAAVILTVAAVVAFVAWLRTTYAYPVRTRKVIAVYLGAIAFQFIHMSEEYLGGFPHELTELFNSSRDWSEKSFLLTFVFGFGAIWILAAAGALYQLRVANYFLWFYALGAGLINAISHFAFPIIKGGYFPGVYTASGHLVMSALLIYLLIKESKRIRTEAETGVRAKLDLTDL